MKKGWHGWFNDIDCRDISSSCVRNLGSRDLSVAHGGLEEQDVEISLQIFDDTNVVLPLEYEKRY